MKYVSRNCPHCGAEIDLQVDPDNPDTPDDGDVACCERCGEWMEMQRVDGEPHLVKPSPSKLHELRNDPDALEKASVMKSEETRLQRLLGLLKAGMGRETGRLVFRYHEGFVEAYMTTPGKPRDEDHELDDAVLLGTMRAGLVREEKHRQMFIELVKATVGAAISRITGGRSLWVDEKGEKLQ